MLPQVIDEVKSAWLVVAEPLPASEAGTFYPILLRCYSDSIGALEHDGFQSKLDENSPDNHVGLYFKIQPQQVVNEKTTVQGCATGYRGETV